MKYNKENSKIIKWAHGRNLLFELFKASWITVHSHMSRFHKLLIFYWLINETLSFRINLNENFYFTCTYLYNLRLYSNWPVSIHLEIMKIVAGDLEKSKVENTRVFYVYYPRCLFI